MKHVLTSIALFIWLGTSLLQAQVGKNFLGEFFKENSGNILFSNKKIDLTSYNKKDIQKNFALLDEIYAQVILKTTLAQTYRDNKYEYDFDNKYFTYNYALILYVNDEKKTNGYSNFRKYILIMHLILIWC